MRYCPNQPVRAGFILVLFLIVSASAFAQQHRQVIQSFLNEKRNEYGLDEKDLSNWSFSNSYTDEKSGISYYYLQQEYRSVPVFNAIAPVIVHNGKAYGLKPPFIRDIERKAKDKQPLLSPVQAIQSALQLLELPATAPGSVLKADPQRQRYAFDLPVLTASPVQVELVYVVQDDMLKLAWNVSLDLKDGSHWWNVRVDALSGQYLEKNDWVISCAFEGPHDHVVHSAAPGPAPQPMPGTGTAQYNIFPLPVESPVHGPRQLLNDPSEPVPSPYGWHDTDGSSGAEYNITRGNNVYAYEDANADNVPGYSPDGGALQVFNQPFHIDSSTAYNRDASLTNLFYMNNVIHDLLYQNGFNEAAGNFQLNNYGNGGLGNDYVNAEGLDGGGTNNANFATPSDGSNPRMQMFLWNGGGQSGCSSLNINTPPAVAGLKSIGFASYNPNAAFNITANLVLVQDGVGTSTDGCTAFTNAAAVAGKIAVIDRGNCNFNVKTQNAQAAGALAVIVVNNVAGAPPAMNGTPTVTITIPTVSVTQSDGTAIKNQLNLPEVVNGTLVVCIPPPPRDGSFDNGIIAHEYGHGVSNRLTGGPAASSCLTNTEQGGEGWSDWLALISTIEPGDSGAMARGIGTFALYQPVTGLGIRRYPYSTNMSINPQTYATLASSSGPHQIGEIWCDAVWDMTWFLIRDFGYSTNLYNGTSGNNIAMKLVLEGMKLQPCNPGYIDARNAILLADDILYGSTHRCQIWEAFARRGMGYYAAQGSSNVVGDETVDFTYPSFCLTPTAPPVAAFTASQTNATCPASIVFSDASANIAQTWSWNFGDGATSSQQNPTHVYGQPGTYTVRLAISNTLGSDTAIYVNYITVSTFSMAVTAAPSPICAGDSVQLNAIPGNIDPYYNYQVSSIPYAPQSGTGTTVALADDAVSTARPIGFSFTFYGNTYSSFYISSNGFIGFSSGMVNGCCSGQSIPAPATPNNLVSFAWNDLNPSVNASVIDYFTSGVAPSRSLVVRYSTNHYNGTAFPMRGQIILYEGSNIIEIHTEVITSVPGAGTTQGIENSSGTLGVTPAGRNAAVFTISNDAVRFTPYPTPYTYSWTPSGNVSNAGLPNPKAVPAFSTSYQVVATAPSGCTSSQSVNVNVILCAAAASLNLHAFIEGYKNGPGSMEAILFNNGMSSNPAACDSITVSLHDPLSPAIAQYTTTALLTTSGNAIASFPPAVYGNTYYIVVRSRNGLETWSKFPQQMAATTLFDLSTP
ncbi:MAG: T9SS-dependent M36 family metallopeptidase [Bacteroidia bacterium]|nr:T9SS-dependent M36 family metallopeptidase [Bacteroidia bacterium]